MVEMRCAIEPREVRRTNELTFACRQRTRENNHFQGIDGPTVGVGDCHQRPSDWIPSRHHRTPRMRGHQQKPPSRSSGVECRRQDLNLHSLNGNQALNLARLPIPPLRLHLCDYGNQQPLFNPFSPFCEEIAANPPINITRRRVRTDHRCMARTERIRPMRLRTFMPLRGKVLRRVGSREGQSELLAHGP